MLSLVLIFLGLVLVKVNSGCGVRYFYGPTGNISSSNYPMNYPNNIDCRSYLRLTFGQTVVITFLSFNTEPSNDWVAIQCESGNAFRPANFSGSEFPSVLTISSCNLVNVYFHTNGYYTHKGFKLEYNITSGTFSGGLTTTLSNAFPVLGKDDHVIFNCTTTSKFLPWWTFSDSSQRNHTITNLTCGVITSWDYSYLIQTETLGPGSCNLIVVSYLSGSVVCTDSTLSSARAIVWPMSTSVEVRSYKGRNFVSIGTDIIRYEQMNISCNPSFSVRYSSPSVVVTYVLYRGGPVVQMRVLRTYWTSEGHVVSSSNTSSTSSYVLVNTSVGVIIPTYTCSAVIDFFSNISDIRGNSTIEVSFSTKTLEVLYWPMEETMTIIGDYNGEIRTPGWLYCNAPANPPATYTWTDESNGRITNGPAITIYHGGKYTCNASNIIREQHYQQSKSINLHVLEDEAIKNIWLYIIILGAILTIAVLAVIILLAIVFRRQKANSVGDVGRGHELQHIERASNRYQVDCGNASDAVDSENGDEDDIYENVNDGK